MFCNQRAQSGVATWSAVNTSRGQLAPVLRQPRSSSRRQAASSSPDYCIIDLNGHRQLVEEGSVFAASAAVLPIGQTALGGKIRFDKVLAARQGDIFVRGQPYVSEMSVEAELVEEFSLGASLNSFDISASSSVSVGKVLVTKIRHTSKTQQVLQEMLSQ